MVYQNVRNLLHTAYKMIAGSGEVVVSRSKRNTKQGFACRYPALLRRLRYYLDKGWLPWQGSLPTMVAVMERGISINGRPWPKGSTCMYTRDIHENAGIRRMGRIVKYFGFYREHEGPVYVVVREHKVVRHQGVMLVVEERYTDEDVVHIDCLLLLYHYAPYYNENNPAIRCCLPVAPAYPLAMDSDMVD